jgi:TolB-like protein
MATGATVPCAYRFKGFRLDLGQRRVFGLEGDALSLSSRAYEVLVHLIERRNEIVSKDDLLRAAWPRVVVGENNLSQAISMLRRELDDPRDASGVIMTVPGRGYRFVARLDVEFEGQHDADASEHESGTPGRVDPNPTQSDVPSLAALPFVNLSNDPDQDYFVDGMMQEIITSLSRIRSLLVIAGSATRSMESHPLDPKSAARRLGVRYVLEGSVRRADSKIRIAVNLIDANTGAQVWADRFEDTFEDVFALQDRVALSIAAAVEPNIAAAELRRVARSPVENLGCYDLYLRASHLRSALRKADVIQALELLDRALSLDPEYAPALAQAAGCHSQIYINRWVEDFEDHRRLGLIMAERAERAAGDDASVLTNVANALMDLAHNQSYNVDRASRLIERATAINPGLANAWFISGLLKLIDGNGDDAVEHLQRATRLDPISHLSEVARAHIGIGLALQGSYDEALRIFRATTYRTPRIQIVLVFVCALLGQMPEAREELTLYEQMTAMSAEAMVPHLTRQTAIQTWLLGVLADVRKPSSDANG